MTRRAIAMAALVFGWLATVQWLTGGVQASTDLVARAGDRSVVLNWKRGIGNRTRNELLRGSSHDGPFHSLATIPPDESRYADFAVTNGTTYFYRLDGDSPVTAAEPHAFASDDDFLDLIQATAFDYFWNEANPTNGLIKDRSTPRSFSSIAATGFGLSALVIGVEHGWVQRAEAAARVRKTLETFWNGPEGAAAHEQMGYRGWFYHFLDMDKGARFATVELSSIDTALLLAGMIDTCEYFDGTTADEISIRGLVDQIYARVDFPWMTQSGRFPTLSMGWKPEEGFLKSRWRGYNEGMILYILALGSLAHPLPASAWEAWTQTYRWRDEGPMSYVEFAPLFGHQYSHCWIDFRRQADRYMQARGITYFENSRRATYANRNYCIKAADRHAGYGPETWGLTASDGPGFGKFEGYAAHGAPPAEHDDGTIAPTGAGASIAFAPEIAIPCLRHLYDAYRANLWTPYGFRDAFNREADWWDPDVLSIDQGPMILMIENYRTGRVWKRFMKNPAVQRGLARAGFRATEARR